MALELARWAGLRQAAQDQRGCIGTVKVYPSELIDLFDTIDRLHDAALRVARRTIDDWAREQLETALIDGSDAGDACGCPCHQVVQPGLVPCPRCEQEGARP